MKILTLITNGERHTIDKNVTIFGRSKEKCDVVISENLLVSKTHFSIIKDHNGDFLIKNNKSTNGTHVGDIFLSDDMQSTLKNGDVIKIGSKKETVEITVEIIEDNDNGELELAPENEDKDGTAIKQAL